MKFAEILFWNVLYEMFYLPLALILHWITNTGSVSGIIVVGLLFNAILTVVFLFIPSTNSEETAPTKLKIQDGKESSEEIADQEEDEQIEDSEEEESSLGGENYEKTQNQPVEV